jgi:hypothetical protein
MVVRPAIAPLRASATERGPDVVDQMEEQEQAPNPEPSSETPRSAKSDAAARAAYARSLRRPRLLYVGIIAIVLIALGVTAAVAYQHGEAAHTTLRTVSTPPPTINVEEPAKTVAQAWNSTDATAIGTPYWKGTVVTYGEHTVRGRNGSTGAQTWSYTRSDRTICSVVQDAGRTYALFRVNGNCDQMTVLDSGTGAREWTRTFDKDGQPINGTPNVIVGKDTLVLWTSSVIYAEFLDNGSQFDRWQFYRQGCTINNVAYGTGGALISMNCTGTKCPAGQKFCGDGPQLLLRDALAGQDSSKTDNPDIITWNLLGSTMTPVAAGAQIIAREGDRLVMLNPKDGKTVGHIDLADPGATTTSLELGTTELVWSGAITYSITNNAEDWDAPMSAVPTASTSDGTEPGVGNGIFAVPGKTGVDLIDTTDGRTTRTVPLASIPTGASAWPYGHGFVLAGTSTSIWN